MYTRTGDKISSGAPTIGKGCFSSRELKRGGKVGGRQEERDEKILW